MSGLMEVTIIAEVGVNHNGDVALALKLIDAAVDAGADIVKFQTFNAKSLVSACAPKADYQRKTTTASESQLDMIRKLELAQDAYPLLLGHCRQRGIRFLSTPFDLGSVDFLSQLGMTMWKIPSGEITNLPYLRKIGALAQPVILSTGMSTLEEVSDALHALGAEGTPQSLVTLLHCTTEYPAPFAEVNLRAMHTLREAFPQCAGVGYSDHTQGIEVSLAAVAMGANIIEKHFTLDRNMEGPDHKASLEPDELRTLVRGIRNIEKAMGNGVKTPAPSEIPNMLVARKSIVAARSIQAGEVFTADNITAKRPGGGLSPMLWDRVIGTQAKRNYAADEALE